MSTEIVIEGYRDFRLIGEGGFSKVYEALQIQFDRRVAVKVLSIGDGRPFDRAAYDAERRSMGVLSSHPNIVTIYDSGVTADGMPFLTMELCELTLYDRLKRGGLLPAEEAIDVGERIALALERAHAEGIVHCDIKPQNIFFSVYGEPALGDFGIAAFEDEGGGKTKARGITLNFAAPELLRGADPTPASDLYALGATLYTAVTGRYPHTIDTGDLSAETAETLLVDAVLDGKPPTPITNAEIPQTLRSMILDLLEFDPAERPASATDVVIELGEIAQGRGLSGHAAEPQRFASPAVDLHADNSPTIVTGGPKVGNGRVSLMFAVVGVLAVVGVGIFLFSRGDDGIDEAPVGSASEQQGQITVPAADSDDTDEVNASVSTTLTEQSQQSGDLTIEGLWRGQDVTQIGCTHNETFEDGLVSIDSLGLQNSTVTLLGENTENAAHVELRIRQAGPDLYWTGDGWVSSAQSFFVPITDTWSYDIDLPDGNYCVIARGRARDNSSTDRGETIAFVVANSTVEPLVPSLAPTSNANLIVTQPNGAHIYEDANQYLWLEEEVETFELRRADDSVVDLAPETQAALLKGERVALQLEPGEYVMDARTADTFNVHYLTVLEPPEPS